MSTRKIKDAKDLRDGSLIYFKGHAKATYMSDGSTVEDAINKIKVNGGGSGNIDLSDYETKLESQAKLQEAKDYTDTRIAELQEGVVTQTIELAKGYNWVSFYVKTSLQDLQSALGNKAISIETSNDGTGDWNIKAEYNAETNTWSGNLIELSPILMYSIQCSESCSIELKGALLNPLELEYTIAPGYTLINYPLDKELSITEALAGLSCAEGDRLKSKEGESMYYNDFGWDGFFFQSMIPGKGYMYYNSSQETKTFYFPSNEEENGDFETKEDALAKLQEAKSYTDTQIQDLKDGIIEQIFKFDKAGIYWISFYIKTSLEELCNALGSNGTKISTSTDSTGSANLILEYNAESNSWSGNLTEIDPSKLYIVTISAPCTVSLQGKQLEVEKHIITLNPGYTYISYPLTVEMSVSQALNGLNATDGDMLKSHEGSFVYYIEGHGWAGGLNSLEPGQGYMYYSYAQETKTFVYPTELDVKLLSKQDVLVSGMNIKTVNEESLLGEGNITILQIIYIPNESSMPETPVEGVLYLIGEE